MEHQGSIISGLTLLLLASIAQAQTVRRWDFDKNNDREGWTVPAEVRGVVVGGSPVAHSGAEGDGPAKMAKAPYQWTGDKNADAKLLTSPAGLQLPAASVTQVRLKVLNLSSLKWRTEEHGWGDETPNSRQPRQSRRCTLKADTKEWQEITCYID